MSAPALVLIAVILIFPIGLAFMFSFTNYSLGSPSFEWVGFDNYVRLATRTAYEQMLWATATYIAIVVPASILLGLVAALTIESLVRGRTFYRAVYFLPVMATLVAMAIVWEFALNPTVGFVNHTLAGVCTIEPLRAFLAFGWWPGVDASATFFGHGCVAGFPNWLGDADTALWTLCFIGIWQALGFNMVLYMAGLASVPRDLYAAAEMDGAATAWSRFWLVTWPMLGPTHLFVVTITMIRSFEAFDSVEALTQGGPARSTYVIMYALYERGVRQNLIGMASAMTMLFLVIVFALVLIQRVFVERRTHYA